MRNTGQHSITWVLIHFIGDSSIWLPTSPHPRAHLWVIHKHPPGTVYQPITHSPVLCPSQKAMWAKSITYCPLIPLSGPEHVDTMDDPYKEK